MRDNELVQDYVPWEKVKKGIQLIFIMIGITMLFISQASL